MPSSRTKPRMMFSSIRRRLAERGDDQSRRRSPATAAAPAATVIGTRNRRQCSQAAPAATAAATAATIAAQRRHCCSSASSPTTSTSAKPTVGEHAADEGEQQQDRGQRHAPLGGEEQARPQAVAATTSGASGRRAVDIDDQADALADRLADPADREQQDRGGDRDENVVEAGDQPEIAPRRPRASARWPSTKARSDAAASALSAPDATASSRSFWLYMDNILPDARERRTGVLLCQYSWDRKGWPAPIRGVESGAGRAGSDLAAA